MGATPRQLMSEDETVEDTTDEVVEGETIEPTLGLNRLTLNDFISRIFDGFIL